MTPLPESLSRPALSALNHEEIESLEQVAERTEREVLDLHGMGPKGIRLLREAMEAEGLAFADDE